MDNTPATRPPRPRLRRLVRVLVVGFWLVMMGTLVRQWVLEVRPEFVPGTYRSALTRERHNHQWRMGVYLPMEAGLTRVGHTQTVYTYMRETGRYKIHNSTKVEFPLPSLLPGIPGRFELDTTTWVSPKYELQQITIQLKSDLADLDCRGTVTDGRLVLHPRVDGQPMDPYEIDLPSGEMVSQGLSRLMSLPPLAEGMRWTTVVVNPLTMRPSVVEMAVLRREKLVWEGKEVDTHVLDILSPPMAARAWVSLSGEVLKEKTLFGLTLIKEPAPEADD